MATVSFEDFYEVPGLDFDIVRLREDLDKILKNKRKTLGLLRDLKNVKTVGIIKNDKENINTINLIAPEHLEINVKNYKK